MQDEVRPLVCRRTDLGGREARHSELSRALIAAVTSRDPIAKGYRLAVSAEKMPFLEVAEWISLEGVCCPFLDFRLECLRDRDTIRLEISGPEGAREILDVELWQKSQAS